MVWCEYSTYGNRSPSVCIICVHTYHFYNQLSIFLDIGSLDQLIWVVKRSDAQTFSPIVENLHTHFTFDHSQVVTNFSLFFFTHCQRAKWLLKNKSKITLPWIIKYYGVRTLVRLSYFLNIHFLFYIQIKGK